MKKIVIIIGFAFSIFCNAQISQDSIAWHQSLMNTSIDDNNQNLTRAAATASTDGSFYVGGNADRYYPVAFKDNNWGRNKATVLELGRSNIHIDNNWNGSLISIFKFHTTQNGHGSNFIDADIKQTIHPNSINRNPLIGGWTDATTTSGGYFVIIWLRGAATYYYSSNCSQSPIITNSSLTLEGKTYEIKSIKDDYVNNYGKTISKNLWVLGSNNYFKGNVGIGTDNPKYKLDVAGIIRAEEVKIEAQPWADFVFDKDYRLPSLDEVKAHIDEHKHLPNIPSEKEVQENGIGLGEMQAKLLQKIEELTLYVIELKEENNELRNKINKLIIE